MHYALSQLISGGYMIKATGSFVAAAKAYGLAIVRQFDSEVVCSERCATLYAIGFLSKMTKQEINAKGREASGLTPEQWISDKGNFSKAHRAIAGEYGLGEWLATQWAAGDFAVSLHKAYELSAAPRTEKDVVEMLARKLASLTSIDVQSVLARYVEIAELQALVHEDVQKVVKATIAELIQAA